MLRLNLNQEMKTIPMPIDATYKVIHVKKCVAGQKEIIIMTGISERECATIRSGHTLFIKRGNQQFRITETNLYCFGHIDFTPGSEDETVLNEFNWLDDLDMQGVCIPARYNYEKHECKTPINCYQYTETFKPADVCRYIHGCLNKPEFSVIFREEKWI